MGMSSNNLTCDDPSVSVTCKPNSTTVTLEKETYHFFNVSELHLRYASCRATENATHFIIRTPLNDCGTFVNETEHVLIFWNEVLADAVIIDNVITRTHDVKLPFSCSYSRNFLLSLGFTPKSFYFGHKGNARISFPENIRSVTFQDAVFKAIHQARVVQKVDNAIHRINHYLADLSSEQPRSVINFDQDQEFPNGILV